MHICIKNIDGTHYQLYGNFRSVEVEKTSSGENLMIGKYDDNYTISVEGPVLNSADYKEEFLKEFVTFNTYREIHIDWLKAGYKLSINGFNSY